MAEYNIKDLEKLSGVKAHTIRIWEKRYNIVSPSRSDTNIRSYCDADLRKLLNLSILNNQGIKISTLAKLTENEIQDKVLFVSQNPSNFNTQIETLILSMLNLDEDQFNQTFNKSVMAHGFEKTFEEIVLKTLDRIGVLWLTGTINPAQEHFISNLIRQKLISNIDLLNTHRTKDSKRFLLFLPEGELHELGLLYANYLVKKRGHEVLYFGQQTPLNSLKDSDKVWNAEYVVVSVITPLHGMSDQEFIDGIDDIFSEKTVMIIGNYAQKINLGNLENIHIFQQIKDFTSFIEKL
jgi:MerR family transcriptional regulator, light-induced transcriptional regulator